MFADMLIAMSMTRAIVMVRKVIATAMRAIAAIIMEEMLLQTRMRRFFSIC